MKRIFIVLCILVISCTYVHAEVNYTKRNKTISVKAEGQELIDLLHKIQVETGIKVVIAEGVEGTVYEDFQDINIEDGLKRILKMNNYSFIYHNGSIHSIYLFPSGTPDTSQTAPYTSIIQPVPKTR